MRRGRAYGHTGPRCASQVFPQGMLRALNLDVQATHGAEPMIIATLEGRKGRVELRGAP